MRRITLKTFMRPLSTILFVGAIATLASAQRTLVVSAYYMATPPVLDGTVDEKNEWAKVPSFTGLIDQNTGQPVSEGGTFWLGYDKKFIYFAARLDDSLPGSIQSTEYRTNVDLTGNDTVTLEVDPFGHHNDENLFTMNASGATTVAIAGGRAAKREWLGEILAKGRITPSGWEVEARIPWKIMRLPHFGRHEVLFNVERDHRRLQKKEAWQYVNGGHVENYGKWESPEIPREVEKTVKLLPYGFGGYDKDTGTIANAGIDVRTPITDTLDFVGSANPDFRNVENGILSLDPSHFARQVAETRPFFLEGQQYFTTSFDEPLFSSQDVSRFDLGFKSVGKIDRVTDLGFLDAISYGKENDLATKVRRQLSAHSWVEGAVTNLEQDGLRNTGTFLQARQDVGPLTFFGQHETTSDTQIGSGHRYNVGVFSNGNGVSNDYEYVEVSPNFLPRLGFAPQVDYKGFSGNTDVTVDVKNGPVLQYQYGWNAHDFSTFENAFYRRGYEFYAAQTMRKDSTKLVFDQTFDRFQGNNDVITALQVARPIGNPYRNVVAAYEFGKFGGQDLKEERVTFAYRPINKLQVTGSLSRLQLDQDTQDQLIFGANWDMGNNKSLNGRLVKQGDSVNAYLAYQRSGNAGAEYFLILGDPNATTTRTTLVLKVTWPLEFKRGHGS